MTKRSTLGLDRLARLLPILLLVALAIRLFVFVDRWAVNVLFRDQWDFLTGLFEHRDPLTLFRWQHGTQREGFGYLLIAAIYSATGWNTRVEIFALAGIVVLASAIALSMVRRSCGPSGWDVCVPLICLTTAQVEIFANTPNPAHGALPFLFIMFCAWSWTVKREPARTACASLANFCAVSTGFSWFVGLITPILFLLDARAARQAGGRLVFSLIGLLISLVTLGLHFEGLRFDPAVGCFQFPHPHPVEYLQFLGLFLGYPFRLGLKGVGGPIAVILAISAVLFLISRSVRLLRRNEAIDREIVLLLGFSILFGFSSAIARVCLGPGAGGGSRYVPYAIPSALALYLWIRSSRLHPNLRIAVLTLLLLACISKELWGVSDRKLGAYFATGKTRWRDCYLANEDIARCNRETRFEVYPSDNPGAVNLPGKLAFLKEHHLNLFRER